MAPTRESDFTETAPYGQACSNCSRAKAKCMRRPLDQGPGPCERCHRRGRDCESMSRSRQKQRRKPTSQTAQLEAKLDSLVSLLQSSHGQSTLLSRTPESSATPGTPDLHGNGNESTGSKDSRLPFARHEIPPASSISADTNTNNTNTGPPSPAQSTGWPVDVSEEEADECLERFRSKLHHFPFISIPPSEGAASLRRDRPILWQCILAVSTTSLPRQQALGSHLRSLFAEKLIVQHERSLELLLALLAYMGWANYQLAPGQLFLCMYSHILIGLVQDLALDQVPKRPEEQHPMSCLKPQGLVMRLAGTVVCTMESRRAAIAAFVITSEIVSFRAFAFQRVIDGLGWTPQMEEHLQVLGAVQESPLDAVLVHMAQLKLIGNEATRALHAYAPQPSDKLRNLQVFQTHSLQLRLEKLRKDASAALDADDFLRLHTIDTELKVHESSLYQMQSDASSAPDMERIAMLSTCVQAVRTWFDVFFGLDPAAYALFGFGIWSQLSHVVVSIYRLTILKDPWWDRDMVRRTIDWEQVLDGLLERMEHVPPSAGCEEAANGRDMGFYPAKSIRAIKAAWGPLLAPKPAGDAATAAGGFNVGGLDGTNATMPELAPELMDGLDSWMDMFSMAWV